MIFLKIFSDIVIPISGGIPSIAISLELLPSDQTGRLAILSSSSTSFAVLETDRQAQVQALDYASVFAM